MLALLTRLLRDAPSPVAGADPGEWWRGVAARAGAASVPVDRAILGGFLADRLAFAFTAGQQAALRALVAEPAWPEDAIVAFCATEARGNHPRSIETRLEPRPGGAFALTGEKRWSTIAPLADVLLVVASEGADEAGRNRLRVARVPARAPGVRIAPMPPPPFMPELPHATVALDGVAIGADAVLPGDGYTRYLKPFRTIEDVHTHAALLGYLVAVARRHAFPDDALERLAAAVVATRVLAQLDPSAPETHVTLAGLLAEHARLLDDLAPAWATADPAERARWHRDAPHLPSIARHARERRRQSAWSALRQQQPPA